jgi:hypothetical protein
VFRKRHNIFMLVLTMLASLVSVAIASPAHAYVESEPRPINAYTSGKCVDLRSQDNWTIQIYSCHGGSNQQWVSWYFPAGSDPNNPEQHFFIFRSKTNNSCIAAGGAGLDLVYAKTGLFCLQTSAMWEIIHEFYDGRTYSVLRNFETGHCLDLRNNDSTNKNYLRVRPCVLDAPSQAWAIGPTPR